MINLYEDIPYEAEGLGKRLLVNREDIRIVQVALKPGQSVPAHKTDGNVNIIVLRGELDIHVTDNKHTAKEGDMTSIPADTQMQVKNESAGNATFLIIKTPKSGTRLQM
ncbi:MAG TPA: cupin domain-containing protein [Desulfomonilia bacterium]